MPYIVQDARKRFKEEETFPANEGELNYVITKLCLAYAEEKGISYATYNQLIGVLECCKLEFYRRAVATYEDEAIARNGDVYK